MSDDTVPGGDPARPRPEVAERRPDRADGAGPRPADDERAGSSETAAAATAGDGTSSSRSKRRRGSRGGRNRSRSGSGPGPRSGTGEGGGADPDAGATGSGGTRPGGAASGDTDRPPRKPRIGDTRPAPAPARVDERDDGRSGSDRGGSGSGSSSRRRRRRGGRGRSGSGGSSTTSPVEAVLADDDPVELDDATLERRRGRERKGRPVGRYLMAVSKRPGATQIAVLEGRHLIEHHVSRPSDDDTQIHGNIYLGRVQNVLPGMEAAFVDIGTPKNAVLYRGDVHFDPDDVDTAGTPRIEDVLKPKQSIICQVTKNPIAHKGARLTQEVSLPGRFVVLVPNSATYGISKRLPDNERKRLRSILDRVKPATHGIIVRTAAENVTAEEIERDVLRLVSQWERIEALASRSSAPALLYREPDMAVRVIREEFNQDYRTIVLDDRELFEEVRDYVSSITPALAERVEYYDPDEAGLPLFERFHVHEQLHKALDRKVWLPSGGSLIIEHTEALTVIDVNTGKNVGSSSLEETVYANNLEAAVEIARQLRLRDIGGIIVIDFIDMETKGNRDEVVRVFRDALARDKTRTQVFEISELGLVEMTRKRIGEGLLESLTTGCPECEGRGLVLDRSLLDD